MSTSCKHEKILTSRRTGEEIIIENAGNEKIYYNINVFHSLDNMRSCNINSGFEVRRWFTTSHQNIE